MSIYCQKMRSRFFLVLCFYFLVSVSAFSFHEINQDSVVVSEIKSLIEASFNTNENNSNDTVILSQEEPPVEVEIYDSQSDSLIKKEKKEKKVYEPIDIQQLLTEIDENRPKPRRIYINDRLLRSNPFFIDLLFYGYASSPVMIDNYSVQDYFQKQQLTRLKNFYYAVSQIYTVEKSIRELRDMTARKVAAYNPYLIAYNIDRLPDVSDFIKFQLDTKPIDESVLMSRSGLNFAHRRMTIEKVKRNPWLRNSNAMLQFSQNYISSNWYQGGSDNISILGILNGRFNYDDKKSIQWENFAEWRLGLNSVEGDTLRTLNTNDDILRATSKLGIKAGGNFFYSGSVDFSTHFFNSYRAVNSPVMRAKFLTPVRFNVNVGLDYKYKKLFSLMLSPVSYKFIYANDTIAINKKSFGIPTGQNILSEIGSSFRAQLSYSPIREIQIDSKLSFYTNYEKFEIDWELVGNFKFNRFLSTRLSLNPRYDNTVIMAEGEKAKIQFKQLLTFGLSYKLL
jgi:hypothetical protein